MAFGIELLACRGLLAMQAFAFAPVMLQALQRLQLVLGQVAPTVQARTQLVGIPGCV